MSKCSLTSCSGAGDKINFSGAGFEVDTHQNGGGAVTGVNIREADEYAALE
ncbi:MAG: hypothetical protein AB7H66_07545 [Hyphomonadaceae bacterium]